MRTTVTLDADIAAAVEDLRKRGLGFSAAVNELARRGLARKSEPAHFRQRTSSGHALVDVTNVAEALELLDGPAGA
ncbi:MAG: CopG family transcriptional regulator [Actinobacteria bacterium]|nr:CopG family transcriptional regulator [Actinomycetota bacterium]